MDVQFALLTTSTAKLTDQYKDIKGIICKFLYMSLIIKEIYKWVLLLSRRPYNSHDTKDQIL